MPKGGKNMRTIEIFRYDPSQGGNGHFQTFEVPIKDETYTTILDVLMRIQREQDPSLAFRYACRVNMCGSCAMVINGRERLACKTNVSDLPRGKTISIRPLNHFPIVKDLVVDMNPFFQKYELSLPFFEPKEIREEPALIRPDSRARQAIGLATECISCGCCVSSCTMVNYHDDYAGPASLNRAFTLLCDSRDGLHDLRLHKALGSCYYCRTEFNCTEVCPKEISPTRAIKYTQILALKARSRLGWLGVPASGPGERAGVDARFPAADPDLYQGLEDAGRRRFLKQVTMGVAALSAIAVAGIVAAAGIGPSLRPMPSQWCRVGKMEDFAPGRVSTTIMNYEIQDGFYKGRATKPVMIARRADVNDIVVFNASCTHLGCTVHWDESKDRYLCACHGGAFDEDGKVTAGPPPRPLDRYAFKVENGYLFVEVA